MYQRRAGLLELQFGRLEQLLRDLSAGQLCVLQLLQCGRVLLLPVFRWHGRLTRGDLTSFAGGCGASKWRQIPPYYPGGRDEESTNYSDYGIGRHLPWVRGYAKAGGRTKD